MFINGSSSSAIENTITNPPTTITQSSFSFSNIDSSPSYESPDGGLTLTDYEDYINDSTFNVGLNYLLSYINSMGMNNLIQTQTMFLNSKTMVLDVFEAYKEELNDESSRLYELFKFLTDNMNELKYRVLILFFRGLKKEFYITEDLFRYLDSNGLDLSIKNIISFLATLKREKAKTIRTRLESDPYLIYGNLFNFINSLFNSQNSVFYREEENTKLFKEDTVFLLKPRINYLSLTDYKNLREAEEDYWLKVSESNFNDISSLVLNRTKTIASIIKNRHHSGTPYGIPTLMKKQIQKFLYLDNGVLDEILISILKDSYRKLSYKEVDKFIDEMCLSIVDFYEQSNSLTFDYSDSSTQIPDLREFVEYKIDQIFSENISLITLKGIKEINFYVNIILPFMNLNTGKFLQLIDLNNIINSDFSILKERIESLRTYILANGKFTE
jgi:hypothetical protein